MMPTLQVGKLRHRKAQETQASLVRETDNEQGTSGPRNPGAASLMERPGGVRIRWDGRRRPRGAGDGEREPSPERLGRRGAGAQALRGSERGVSEETGRRGEGRGGVALLRKPSAC